MMSARSTSVICKPPIIPSDLGAKFNHVIPRSRALHSILSNPDDTYLNQLVTGIEQL